MLQMWYVIRVYILAYIQQIHVNAGDERVIERKNLDRFLCSKELSYSDMTFL